jgi:pimeloyl-ACP methyl ester carboxylesterase
VRVDEHTICLDDSPVYYRSADRSGMPALYLHGIPTSSDDWLGFLGRTGGIAPDLIGFGRSGKGGHLDYSLTGLTAFVERFLDHLGVGEVQLVGHDWGAAVGLVLAQRNPGRVRRLLLSNPPALHDTDQWPRLFRLLRAPGVGELIMGATTKGLLTRTLRHGSVSPEAWPEQRLSDVWHQFDQGTQRAILRLVRSVADNMGGARRPGWGEAGNGGNGGGNANGSGNGGGLASLRPVIIWGEEDPWYPPALADAFAARLPGATVERIAGAGHWPWLDRPEVVDRVASLLEG